jgi:hypothetical protein
MKKDDGNNEVQQAQVVEKECIAPEAPAVATTLEVPPDNYLHTIVEKNDNQSDVTKGQMKSGNKKTTSTTQQMKPVQQSTSTDANQLKSVDDESEEDDAQQSDIAAVTEAIKTLKDTKGVNEATFLKEVMKAKAKEVFLKEVMKAKATEVKTGGGKCVRAKKRVKKRPAPKTPEALVDDEDIQKRTWETRFEELLEYKKRFEHVNVPYGWKENRNLGKWASLQRKQYKALMEGKITTLNGQTINLSEGQIRRLIGIGEIQAYSCCYCTADSSLTHFCSFLILGFSLNKVGRKNSPGNQDISPQVLATLKQIEDTKEQLKNAEENRQWDQMYSQLKAYKQEVRCYL